MSDDRHSFDKEYWERHWTTGDRGPGSMSSNPPNPHLVRETEGLTPGTALDAGCGAGTEALWLASRGWRVTGVDISAEALAHAARKTEELGITGVEWVEADASSWQPASSFDLVTTHYAHPSIPQLQFYERLASWVARGGTLLVVGHASAGDGHGHGHPEEASVTAPAMVQRLHPKQWRVETAREVRRTLPSHGDPGRELVDVVVRATRE